MLKIYDDPESPNEGGGAMIRMYVEPETPNERARLGFMMKPVSSNEGAFLRIGLSGIAK